MDGKIYYDDDRAKVRSSLTNEEHHYVVALEKIAVAAYHVWKNTPHANKPHDLTRECLNDLYDALAVVDFMAGDEAREE